MTIEFTLDGERVAAQPGETILAVARRLGKDIPTLCHDPRLQPFTSCFVCLVEQKGRPGFVPSCATRVAPNMEIVTDSAEIRAARRLCLELLMSAHDADCVAPCRLRCPDNIDIQTYIAQIAAGEHQAALRTIKRTNPFPSACGRVCPHTCELDCRRTRVDEPVAINPLKRFAADQDLFSPDAYLPPCEPETGRRVAIVGGGPAGLTAAYYLRQRGHTVVVFEMNKKPGGMLRYGIPRYRLPDEALDLEIEHILALGIELRTGQKLGRDFTLASLREQGFDAALLAVGAWTSSSLRVPGEELPGVLAGIDYLFRVANGEQVEVGRRVVVVGGGNTAIDAARTARRFGADVTILYRRTRAEMPAAAYEVDEAEREGVHLHFLAAPVSLAGAGRVERIRSLRMELGEPDASGRRKPVPIEGSEFEIEVDTVIAAIGQAPDTRSFQGPEAPRATKWSTVEANERTYQTGVPWVFTAGDCLTGAATAIEAIAGGRKASISIDRTLRGLEPLPIGKPFSDGIARLEDLDEVLSGVPRVPRVHGPELPVAERMDNFREVELTIDQKAALLEAGRCLSCGCTAVDTCDLRRYADQYGVDLKRFPTSAHHRPILSDHPFLIYDPNKCILCGRCVRICDEQQGAAALGFINRGFETHIAPSLSAPLLETDCDACGQCVSTCPTGALDVKRPLPKPGPYPPDRTQVVCGFCGVHCRLEVETTAGRYVRSVACPDEFHNRGNLCVDGSFGHRFLETADLVQSPAIGAGPATWQAALQSAALGLKQADGIAVLARGPLSNEEAYVLGRLARTKLKTTRIALLDEPDLDELPPFGGTLALGDLAAADLLVWVGGDPFEVAPVAGIELRRAALQSQALFAIGPRASRLDTVARRVIRTGREALTELLGALADLAKGGAPESSVARALRAGVKPAALTDLVARLRAAERPAIVADQSLGPLAFAALLALAGATGHADRLLILRQAPNSLGRARLGLSPRHLPLGASQADLRRLWGEEPAMGRYRPADILAELVRGRLGAALVIERDFRPLDLKLPAGVFTVVFGLRRGTLAERADVLFPAGALAETQGTLTALDGRVLSTEPVRRPTGGKTLFQGLLMLADALGSSIPLAKPHQVWEELGRFQSGIEAFAGPRLPQGGKLWV